MNTRQIGKRIENLEVRLENSTSKGYVDPFETSPEELEKIIKTSKQTCRSAEEKCGQPMETWGSIERNPEEPTDLRLRARFWARRAVTASMKIMMWERYGRRRADSGSPIDQDQ